MSQGETAGPGSTRGQLPWLALLAVVFFGPAPAALCGSALVDLVPTHEYVRGFRRTGSGPEDALPLDDALSTLACRSWLGDGFVLRMRLLRISLSSSCEADCRGPCRPRFRLGGGSHVPYGRSGAVPRLEFFTLRSGPPSRHLDHPAAPWHCPDGWELGKTGAGRFAFRLAPLLLPCLALARGSACLAGGSPGLCHPSPRRGLRRDAGPMPTPCPGPDPAGGGAGFVSRVLAARPAVDPVRQACAASPALAAARGLPRSPRLRLVVLLAPLSTIPTSSPGLVAWQLSRRGSRFCRLVSTSTLQPGLQSNGLYAFPYPPSSIAHGPSASRGVRPEIAVGSHGRAVTAECFSCSASRAGSTRRRAWALAAAAWRPRCRLHARLGLATPPISATPATRFDPVLIETSRLDRPGSC